MNDNPTASEYLPEFPLQGLFQPAVLEVVQLLLFIFALIVLFCLVAALFDLILLCREELKKSPQRPTTKGQTQSGMRTRIVWLHVARFGKWK
jgi:hypothetical protein